jgi:DNA-binding Lrp family transcriptional regulator
VRKSEPPNTWMSNNSNTKLKKFDIQLLLLLQEDPLANYSKLSLRLKRPVKTISKWVSTLEFSGVLRPVKAILNYKSLDLEIFDVLVSTHSLNEVKYLETLCDAHPFTIYRSRINGAINGLYIQFQAPNGSLKYFNELFAKLKKKLAIEIKIFHSDEQSSSSTFNLDYWDQSNLEWDYDWNEWHSRLNSHFEGRDGGNLSHKKEKYSPLQSDLTQLSSEDIFILAKLTQNAKIKQKTLIEKMEKENLNKISPQRLSEKIRWLKENFIYDYRLYLNLRVINLYTTLLFQVKCKESFSDNIQYLVESFPPPFPGHFRKNKEGFLWYLSLPPSHFSPVSSLLWHQSVDSFKVNFLDYGHSMTYHLFWKTFDESNHNWILNNDFMIDDPIKEADKVVKL